MMYQNNPSINSADGKKIKLTINIWEFNYKSLRVDDQVYTVSLNEIMEINKIWVRKPKNLHIFAFLFIFPKKYTITFMDGKDKGGYIEYKTEGKTLRVIYETEEKTRFVAPSEGGDTSGE